MDPKLDHRRNLVETVISVLERRYGSAVSSRVWWRQFRERVAMAPVYNGERAMKTGVSLLVQLLSRLLGFPPQRISTEPNNSVSHPDDLPPRHLGMLLAQLFRKVAAGFADDLQFAHNTIL